MTYTVAHEYIYKCTDSLRGVPNTAARTASPALEFGLLALELLARGRDGGPPPPHADAHELHLGFGRIVASETEAPNMLANLV